MRKLLLTKILLAVALLGAGAMSAWAAKSTETYDFTKTLGNFSYASSYFTYSNGTWGYKATGTWLNGRFSFADGTTSGAHRNYWQTRSFKSNNVTYTGLNYTQITDRQFGIHDLKNGDVIVLTIATGSFSSLTTNIKIEGESDVLAAGTALVSGTRYVVSTEDETTLVEIMGAQYNCLTKLVIETTETETITAPTMSVAANGSNRTVTITSGETNSFDSHNSVVTTYYTTDGTDPTTSSSVYSEPLDISSDCTVKAISVATGGTTSDIVSQEVTVGALTLNTPTIKKTAYSDGSYTVQITSDQSGLDIVPASPTIYYSINSGDATAYTAAIAVSAGSTITAYVAADGYTNSATATSKASCLPSVYTTTMNIDFTSISTLTQGNNFTVAKSYNNKDATTFYNITEASDNNFGMFGTTTSGNNSFNIHNGGLYNQYGGPRPIGLQNLSAGDIIRINISLEPTYTGTTYYFTNCTALEGLNYGNYYHYVVTADGNVSIPVAKTSSLYTIEVLQPTNTIVGALDNSTTDRGATHDLATLSDGDVYKVTFQNHGSSAANKNNFLAYVKNSSSTIVATMYADWYDYVNGGNTNFTNAYATSMDGGLTLPASCWTNYFTDMADCPVELTFSYSDGTLRIAGTATKDNHIYYYNYAYSGLEGDVTVGLSVCAAWVEVLSTSSSASVSGTIASSGYSTIASPYALNLAAATGIEAAYVATKTTNEAVTLTSVESAVPAGTPLILKGTGGAAYSIPVVATGTAPVTNYLSAAIVPTGIAANAAYILQGGLFHLVSAASTVPAGKAYLLASDVPAGARALSFTFDDETTDIKMVNGSRLMDQDSMVYELQGRHVKSSIFNSQSSILKKGLYIVNGKKVIIK